MMTRRAFLQLLSVAAAGLTIDPERLLWTPRQQIAVPANYGVDLAIGEDQVVAYLTQMAGAGRIKVVGHWNHPLDDDRVRRAALEEVTRYLKGFHLGEWAWTVGDRPE